MATVAGYAVMPVIPSFDNISREIDKQISGPLSKASKQAGDALGKGVGAGIEQAGDRAEKAQFRVKKATQELEQAQSKVAAATNAQAAAQSKVEAAAIKVSQAQRKHETAVNSALGAYENLRKSGTASADQLAAAEQKIADVRSKGQADIASKEGALESARGRLVTATQRVTDAQNKLNDAELEHLTASTKAEQAADELAKAQSEAGRTTEETGGIFERFRSQVRDMGAEMDKTAQKSGGFGAKLADGFKTMGKGALLGVGAKAGTMIMDGVNTAVSKGMSRLESIEQAGKMLEGLGYQAGQVDTIMDNAMESVKGTAYGFGEAASMAATFVGAGVQEGEDLTRVLKLVGDTAAITGSDFQEMGSIWTKIASNQKLSTEEMNQLMDRGLGLLPKLQEKYGVTAEEARKMVSEGKIGFEDFASVMEDMVGGAAQGMGETFQGSFANMQAALGRFGAKLLDPVFKNAPMVFSAIGSVVDDLGKRLDPVIDAVSDRLQPVFENIAQNIGPAMNGAIDGVANAFGWLYEKVQPAASAVGMFGEAVQVAWGELTAAFQGGDWGFGQLAEWFGEDRAQSIVNGVAALGDSVSDFLDSVGDLARALWDSVGPLASALWESLKAVGEVVFTLVAPAIDLITGLFTDTDKSAEGASKNGVTLFLDSIKFVTDSVAWLADNVLAPTVRLIGDLAEKFSESQVAIDIFKGTLAAVGTAYAAAKIPSMVSGMASLAVQAGKAAANLGRMAAASVVKGIGALVEGIKGARSAMVALNTAMVANPILAVATAIAAITAGLVYFFTKTETGKQMWADFTGFVSEKWTALAEGVKATWDSVTTFFTDGYNNYVKPVFEGLVEVGKWAFTIIATTVLTPLVLAWEAMSWAVQAAWVNIIKPTWDALAAGAQWLWTGVLQPAFDGIKWAFEQMGAGLQWVYDNILKPVFDGFVWLAQQAWNGAVVIFDGIKWAFQAMADGLRWVNDNVVQPVWNAFGAGLTWLHDNVVAPVTSWIGDKWSRMGDGFNAVKNFVVDKVFGGFQRGLDTLKGWVDTTADAMGRLWDGIREKFAKPINFVIETVYTNGIKPVFDGVAKKVGLDSELPEIPSIGGFASGGVLPGYTPGRDPYTFVEPRTGMSIGLSGGEAILRPEATRALGSQWVDNINRAARSGGRQGVERALMHSHFATGGIVHLGNFANGGFTNLAGGLSAVQQSMGSFVGRFFPGMFNLTSATRPGDPGFHGRGLATDWQAKDGQYQTQMPTPQSKALARAIYTNFRNSTELIHYPLDGWENLKWGNPANYPAGTNAQHGNHVHWAIQSPLRFDGDDIVLDDVPGAGGSHFSPLGFFTGLWDSIIGKLPSFDLPGFGDLAQVPGAALKTLGGWVKDWALGVLKDWGDKFMNFLGLGGGGADQWSSQAEEALRRLGFGPEHLGAMLRQIEIESGGDPRAVNNWDDNARKGTPSGGLLQVIEPTYRDMRRMYPEAFEGLPDDRFHPMTNLVAGVAWTKYAYGGPGNVWPTRDGYATGGVLPGFTPGRDIYQFVDPRTGMSIGLSGGESIMVPEWTRAVGGPAAVAAMNKAARAGRSSGGSGFADGGVFSAARGGFDAAMASVNAAVATLQAAANEIQSAFAGNNQGYDALAATLRNEQWAKAIVDGAAQLGKIADYNSLEGVAARSFASEMAGIAGMLGGKTVSTVTSSLLGAEKQIWDAREGYASRTADIAAKEKAVAEARKAAGDAASAEASEEQELAAARKASAQALDMRIFDVAPQINGMLLQAAAATAAVPQVSGALAGLAAVAGPAGVSVGVALTAVKVGIDTVEKVGGAIGEFVARIFDARGKTYANMVTVMNLQHEWAQMVDEQASKVAELRVAWVEAQVALRDATWKTRLAQADVVRAQLQGVKSVAEAEAKLEAERNRVARAALRNFDDLSLAYDRYRWAEYQGMVDRLDLQAAVTPEILALESEVAAARLNAMAAQKEASLGALQASWEQQKAALALMQTQQNLALQTQQLAVMQREFFGMSQAESLQAMNTMKLRQELAEVQSQQGKNFWRLSYWLTGAHRADELRERALREQIAGREGGVDSPRGAGAMAFFGYGDSALNAARNAGYGRAEQAMFEAQEQQALLQLEQQKQQLQQQIEQSRLFEQYQQQVGALTAEIESLQAGASAAQYTADYYREENTAVRAANLALAQFEADRSSQYAAVGRGEKQVVEITIPQQDVYTREQMDLVLRSVQEIPELEARIRKAEAPATPGANMAMRNLIGG